MLPTILLGGVLALGQSPSPEALPDFPVVKPARAGEPPATTTPGVNITVESPLPQPPNPPALAQVKKEESPPDDQLLMKFLQGTWYGAVLGDNRVTVSGWAEGSFTASTDRRNQLPMGFNFQANTFQIEQNWVRIERKVDESATTPTWGFLIDTIMPGTDYRFTVARGLLSSQLTADHGSPNLYGFDPVQFYSEWYLPDVGRGLDLKLGRFFAPFGVESIDTVLNPFASRSYTFIYNPFTNTGLLSTLKLSEEWTVQNGVVTGSDVFIDRAATPTYVGSVKWEPVDEHASAEFAVILGCGRYNRAQNFNNPQIFDLVLTYKLDPKLTWTGEALYGFQTNVPGIDFANWFGVVNYLGYQFDKKWTADARFEVFDDAQGQRTGYRGVYEAVTLGATYKPLPYLWVRPEIRYDQNDSGPFEGKPNLFTAALDFIVRW